MKMDELTGLGRKAINILFVDNPTGTSLGVLIGIILQGVIALFEPVLKSIEIINIAAIKTWHLVCLGVVSINVPQYLRRYKIDPSIESAIDYIEQQKKSGRISDWQSKQMYSNLHNKVLESVTLETERKKIADSISSLVTERRNESQSNK